MYDCPFSAQVHVRYGSFVVQVHLPAQAPRQPTLRECEIIIRHLQHVGDKQAHEVGYLN